MRCPKNLTHLAFPRRPNIVGSVDPIRGEAEARDHFSSDVGFAEALEDCLAHYFPGNTCPLPLDTSWTDRNSTINAMSRPSEDHHEWLLATELVRRHLRRLNGAA